jgi:hypothetical protein
LGVANRVRILTEGKRRRAKTQLVRPQPDQPILGRLAIHRFGRGSEISPRRPQPRPRPPDRRGQQPWRLKGSTAFDPRPAALESERCLNSVSGHAFAKPTAGGRSGSLPRLRSSQTGALTSTTQAKAGSKTELINTRAFKQSRTRNSGWKSPINPLPVASEMGGVRIVRSADQRSPGLSSYSPVAPDRTPSRDPSHEDKTAHPGHDLDSGRGGPTGPLRDRLHRICRLQLFHHREPDQAP